jgi:hypothetical protein
MEANRHKPRRHRRHYSARIELDLPATVQPVERIERAHLHELERVMRLRLVVDTEHIEARTLESDRRASSATEEVDDDGITHRATFPLFGQCVPLSERVP